MRAGASLRPAKNSIRPRKRFDVAGDHQEGKTRCNPMLHPREHSAARLAASESQITALPKAIRDFTTRDPLAAARLRQPRRYAPRFIMRSGDST